MKVIVGIIGCGNMGSAIGRRIMPYYKVHLFDKDKTKTVGFGKSEVLDNIVELIKRVDVVVLAIKPQDFDALLEEIKDLVKEKLIISIAAGITTGYVEEFIGQVKIIRSMPNMPAKIGHGITCVCKGRFASEDDLDFAKELFSHTGQTLFIKEEMMDAATAISGSGPGYLCDYIENKNIKDIEKFTKEEFIPSLIESAIAIGFTEAEAKLLSNTTADGTLSVIKDMNQEAGELKRQITSKGGTTQAALDVLHRGGTLKDAVFAALKRSKELVKKR